MVHLFLRDQLNKWHLLHHVLKKKCLIRSLYLKKGMIDKEWFESSIVEFGTEICVKQISFSSSVVVWIWPPKSIGVVLFFDSLVIAFATLSHCFCEVNVKLFFQQVLHGILVRFSNAFDCFISNFTKIQPCVNRIKKI